MSASARPAPESHVRRAAWQRTSEASCTSCRCVAVRTCRVLSAHKRSHITRDCLEIGLSAMQNSPTRMKQHIRLSDAPQVQSSSAITPACATSSPPPSALAQLNADVGRAHDGRRSGVAARAAPEQARELGREREASPKTPSAVPALVGPARGASDDTAMLATYSNTSAPGTPELSPPSKSAPPLNETASATAPGRTPQSGSSPSSSSDDRAAARRARAL